MSDWMSDHEHRLGLLRRLLAFSVLSTGIHFSHNFFSIEDYPPGVFGSETAVQVAIIVAWPLFTAAGLYGYRLYRQRRYVPANLLIGLYSALGITTLGHFTSGSPEIPSFFYLTIFTDGLVGLALLAFAVWSARSPLPAGAPAPA
ncbi:MAG: hypothetical protein M3O25_01510 [Actinomycetota bacterium]|nr:hypothetical protein [Actinomycetota bacterium]